MYRLTQKNPGRTVSLIPVSKEGLTHFKEQAGEFTRNLLDGTLFEAEHGQFAVIAGEDGVPVSVLIGVDKPPDDPRATLHLFARLAAGLSPKHTYAAESWPDLDWEAAALGWGLAGYKFSEYLKKKAKHLPDLYLPETVNLPSITNQLAAMFMARDLINIPANDLGPRELCARARALAEENGAVLEILEGKDLLEKGYPAVYTVGLGSTRPPALIDLRWGSKDLPSVTLVGKGVVFDTGGLDLKPAGAMRLMKKDMGGAAVTLGLAQLIMKEKLPVHLRLLVPTVENAPGQSAYRPGDIIKTRKGISVEIGNTDAEGRVILCDALAEAVSEKPDLVIDMATLTGACRIALGQDIPGFYTPSDELARALTAAADKAVDPLWRLPLWQPYRKNLKSSIAGINNMANTSYGGSITAALFLHEFVKPFRNWVHLDIFGWRTDNLPGTPKGAEASALRAVFRFLEDRYRS